jgi:hypothetical protein
LDTCDGLFGGLIGLVDTDEERAWLRDNPDLGMHVGIPNITNAISGLGGGLGGGVGKIEMHGAAFADQAALGYQFFGDHHYLIWNEGLGEIGRNTGVAPFSLVQLRIGPCQHQYRHILRVRLFF